MEKILLVTGKLAEESVRKAAAELGVDVKALPIEVAQFMSTELAIEELKEVSGYDKIVFPGMVRADLNEIEKAIGIPCFKGPRYPFELKLILKPNLSKEVPADDLFEKNADKEYEELIKTHKPPQIIAEIVDAPLMSNEVILKRAQYYLGSGANVIDVGAIAGEDNSKRLGEIVKLLKSKNYTVSIDSLNPNELNAAIEGGVDIVLSLSGENMGKVTKADITYVVIPEDGKINLDKARGEGYKNLVADPILAPPFRIAQSISDYYEFRKKDKSPLLMGVGNIVELMDVDSPGLNGLLAAIAVELDASYLLTTENSEKTRGAVEELAQAIKLNFLAKHRGSLPKDLGTDLFKAKGKKPGQVSSVITAQDCEEDKEIEEDSKGYFNIFVDFGKNRIMVSHSGGKTFEGTSAEAISKKIVSENLISNMQHAAYLGRELQKAETSLRNKKGYIQDD